MIVEEVERTAIVAVERAGFVAAEVDRAPTLVVRADSSPVINVEQLTHVTAPAECALVYVAGGNQGPQGIQGPQGSGVQVFNAVAGATLGGHRAVYIDASRAQYADPSAPSADRVAGITLGAASEDDQIVCQSAGEIAEPSWNWAEGPVFLGVNGTLTQNPPAGGVFVELGIATEPTKVIVRIGPPIHLQ